MKIHIAEIEGGKYFQPYELESKEQKDFRFSRDYDPIWNRIKAVGEIEDVTVISDDFS